jgi:hypothetical protein
MVTLMQRPWGRQGREERAAMVATDTLSLSQRGIRGK